MMNKINQIALDKLTNQFPNVGIIHKTQQISEASFKLQSEKHLAKQSLGGAIGVIQTPENKFILVNRHNLHPGWALPGGSVEADENFLDAFKREINEEIGLEPVQTSLLLIEKKQFISPSGKKLNFLLAIFNAEITQSILPEQTANAKQEQLEVALFEFSALPKSMVLADREKLEYFHRHYLKTCN